ncbi:transposase [Microbacterium hydrocarbonoxydans]|uniref:transposase n=1 Tax=Microbacterium hydrocarbonoxydans TaxID=273678 RepID=UPI0013DD248A|nr:transposase [Microbacterium hydrocarbonoxydans]
MAARTLTEIAAELYLEPPAAFTAARDAIVRSTTDKALAAQIRKLKKPSVAAWVVNVFATERSAQLGEALRLAEELHEAQADLDAATLSALGRERRTLTNRLAQNAADLAESRGERVTPATLEAVRQTLSAAFFDAGAAAAVASGRLVRELDPSGDVDVAGAVAGGEAAAPEIARPAVDEVGERRERRRAERALREAEKDLERAERARTAAADAQREHREALERLTAREAELEAELARTRKHIVETRSALSEAEEGAAAVAARVDEAEAATTAARRALEEVLGG